MNRSEVVEDQIGRRAERAEPMERSLSLVEDRESILCLIEDIFLFDSIQWLSLGFPQCGMAFLILRNIVAPQHCSISRCKMPDVSGEIP
jgi:hypothetical protein